MDDELEAIRRRMAEKLLSSSRKETQEAPTAPVVLTDQSFPSFISDQRLSVIDFWAEWCAPCRFVSPIIEQLAKQYAGRVLFGKLDVDRNQVTAARYGIRSIPTIMFFRAGKPVDAIIGALPKNQIESRIVRLMSAPE